MTCACFLITTCASWNSSSQPPRRKEIEDK
jgi:hypothetical protein